LQFQANPRQKRAKSTEGMAQAVECLPCKHKAVTQTPVLPKKKKGIYFICRKIEELEIILLNEISKAQKTKCHLFLLICGL
jgi:hypothetical protein